MRPHHQPAATTDVTDPVCGMTIEPADAVGHLEHHGHTYYFCNKSCLKKFRANPETYTSGGVNPGKRTTPAPTGTYTCPMHPEIEQETPGSCPKCGMALEPRMPVPAVKAEWTCPMHPEIVRDAPGTCPICGMALEPRTPTAVDGENPELRDMTRADPAAVAADQARRLRLGLQLPLFDL